LGEFDGKVLISRRAGGFVFGVEVLAEDVEELGCEERRFRAHRRFGGDGVSRVIRSGVARDCVAVVEGLDEVAPAGVCRGAVEKGPYGVGRCVGWEPGQACHVGGGGEVVFFDVLIGLKFAGEAVDFDDVFFAGVLGQRKIGRGVGGGPEENEENEGQALLC
jgi:hypothetical protein